MTPNSAAEHIECERAPTAEARVTRAMDRLRGLSVAFKSADGSGPADALEHEWLLLHRFQMGPFPSPVEFRRTARDRAYMTTAWIDGEVLADSPRIGDARQLYQLLQGALKGLAYLHRSGLVHGDVRPQNLLFGESPAELEVHWTDLEHARRFGQLAAGFAHIAGWNPDAESSGGVQSPRTDLRALGESLRDPVLNSGLGDSGLAQCLRNFVAELCDEYGLGELKDAENARYRLAEAAAASGTTVVPPQPIAGPPLLIHNRVAERQWRALRDNWLQSGQTRVLFVEGPTGCGKTAFLRSAAADLAVAGHAVLDWNQRSAVDPLLNPEAALVRAYLRAGTRPPVVLLDTSAGEQASVELQHHVPPGTWILVETRSNAVAEQASPDSALPGPSAWSFPPLSAREWYRWVGDSI
jgi:hypothetical protein